MFSSRTLLAAAATVAVTALLLTGCAGAPQSTKQACASLNKDLSLAAADLSSAFNKVQSDPKAAEKSLATVESALKSANAKVSNATITTATSATIAAVDKMDVALNAYIKKPTSTSDLEKAAIGVQTAFTKLGGLCAA